MLRITEHKEDERSVRLRLDGTLTDQSFAELETALSQKLLSNGCRIVLDMSGVSFMQEAAANKLAKLRGESLHVVNCSPFIAALLELAARRD
jgi:anti-anti-sigma regulatory factor